jgi:hypothetical protein
MYIEYASIHRVHCCTYHIFVWWYYNYKILKSMGYKILKRMRLPRATCLSWRGGVVARAWAWRSWPPTWEGGDREWWHGHGPKSIPTRVHWFRKERTMGQVSSGPVGHALTCTYWPSTDIGQKNETFKLLWLLNGVSIFNFICTGVLYATKRTKLDPTYIYFGRIFSNSNLYVLLPSAKACNFRNSGVSNKEYNFRPGGL